MAHHYIAQFLPQEDGTFCVFFPDLEGCNTFGDTLQEAFEAAQDAATGWLEVEADRGTPLPAPSSLAAAKAKAEAHCRELEIDVPEGTLYPLVPVAPPAGKARAREYDLRAPRAPAHRQGGGRGRHDPLRVPRDGSQGVHPQSGQRLTSG